MLSFWAQFSNPLIYQFSAGSASPLPAQERAEVLGVEGVLIYAALLSGVMLLLLHRFRLPFGSLTLVYGLSAIFVTGLVGFDRIIAVALVAGLLGDILLVALAPSMDRPGRLRLAAFGVPCVYFLNYFLALRAADGIWWPIHVWTGAVLIAGLCGLALSGLLLTPLSLRRPE